MSLCIYTQRRQRAPSKECATTSEIEAVAANNLWMESHYFGTVCNPSIYIYISWIIYGQLKEPDSDRQVRRVRYIYIYNIHNILSP